MDEREGLGYSEIDMSVEGIILSMDIQVHEKREEQQWEPSGGWQRIESKADKKSGE